VERDGEGMRMATGDRDNPQTRPPEDDCRSDLQSWPRRTFLASILLPAAVSSLAFSPAFAFAEPPPLLDVALPRRPLRLGPGAWSLADRAEAYLQALPWQAFSAAEPPLTDRHGRAFEVPVDGDGRSVQLRLIAAGLARVMPWSGRDRQAWLVEEARARRARIGLWSQAVYRVRAARAFDGLLDMHHLVLGRVHRVRRRAGGLFLNFGPSWHEDLTAVLTDGASDGAAVGSLEEGRLIRLRGWVNWRGGPWLDVDTAQQIEWPPDPLRHGAPIPEH